MGAEAAKEREEVSAELELAAVVVEIDLGRNSAVGLRAGKGPGIDESRFALIERFHGLQEFHDGSPRRHAHLLLYGSACFSVKLRANVVSQF